PLRLLRPGMKLHHAGGERWELRDTYGTTVVASYVTDDLRYSVSWKAYCFRDEAERDAWAAHSDDLTLQFILERLVADLCDRGRLDSPDHGLSDAELGRLLINEYVRFPAAAPAG